MVVQKRGCVSTFIEAVLLLLYYYSLCPARLPKLILVRLQYLEHSVPYSKTAAMGKFLQVHNRHDRLAMTLVIERHITD